MNKEKDNNRGGLVVVVGGVRVGRGGERGERGES
jgi:hypothetical protein